jgi:hypothetical protein
MIDWSPYSDDEIVRACWLLVKGGMASEGVIEEVGPGELGLPVEMSSFFREDGLWICTFVIHQPSKSSVRSIHHYLHGDVVLSIIHSQRIADRDLRPGAHLMENLLPYDGESATLSTFLFCYY